VKNGEFIPPWPATRSLSRRNAVEAYRSAGTRSTAARSLSSLEASLAVVDRNAVEAPTVAKRWGSAGTRSPAARSLSSLEATLAVVDRNAVEAPTVAKRWGSAPGFGALPLRFLSSPKTETPHPGPYLPKTYASKASLPKPQPPDNFRWPVCLVRVVVYI